MRHVERAQLPLVISWPSTNTDIGFVDPVLRHDLETAHRLGTGDRHQIGGVHLVIPGVVGFLVAFAIGGAIDGDQQKSGHVRFLSV